MGCAERNEKRKDKWAWARGLKVALGYASSNPQLQGSRKKRSTRRQNDGASNGQDNNGTVNLLEIYRVCYVRCAPDVQLHWLTQGNRI